jgi:hypothetical protein
VTKGYVTLVSPEDAYLLRERAWSASVPKNGRHVYAVSRIGKLHKLIVLNSSVDHDGGGGLDNRRPILRPATQAENIRSARSHKNSSSKFKGVCWYKPYNKWRVQICFDYLQHHVGYFEDEEDAARAYDTEAIKLHGKFARLNFPQA